MEDQKEQVLDIRQKLCWDYYINPKSPTFGNGYKSGLKAGYTQKTSSVVTTQDWFKKKLIRLNLLSKAEKVLNKTLDMETADDSGRQQADLLRIQNDTAKFVAKTLGKEEGYSERTELTGKDGNDIVFMPAELMDKYNLLTNKPQE